jgi:integrase
VQRPDGRFRCKYKGKEFYGKTEDEAFDARDAYIASLSGATITPTTVAEFAIQWLQQVSVNVSDSTYNSHAVMLQHLIDCIGYKRICEVVPSDIKRVYSEYYSGKSNSYITSTKQLYCSLFDAAFADGLIRFNPARDRSAKPHKGNKTKERILTPQQREWIETLCTDHRVWPAVMTMLYAGLRPQEMKALNIDRDVDFENDTITVRETAHREGEKYAFSGEMKTEWSYRKVPLFPPLKSALSGKHGYLITSACGERVSPYSWKRAWESYVFCMETAINGCRKRWYGKTKLHRSMENLPEWTSFDIVPYTLRHAYCAFLRDSGVEINTARKWMGHSDTKMILKVYDSVSNERYEQERQKVIERLKGQNGGQQSLGNL